MSRINDHLTIPRLRTDRSSAAPLAILIAVPNVNAKAARIQPRAIAPAWGEFRCPPDRYPWPGQGQRQTRRRRRLRRPIRLAGWAMLALASSVGAGALGWDNRAESTSPRGGPLPVQVAGGLEPSQPAHRPSPMVRAGPAAVVLSIEPVVAVGASAAAAEVPVVFPGYVLPDDSLEEPAHEGS